MSEESNCLHELAERLRPFSMSSGAKFYPTASDRDDIGKAVRIIEELAKVRDVDGVHNLEPVKTVNEWDAIDAIVKCRSIAKGGAGDGSV